MRARKTGGQLNEQEERMNGGCSKDQGNKEQGQEQMFSLEGIQEQEEQKRKQDQQQEQKEHQQQQKEQEPQEQEEQERRSRRSSWSRSSSSSRRSSLPTCCSSTRPLRTAPWPMMEWCSCCSQSSLSPAPVGGRGGGRGLPLGIPDPLEPVLFYYASL